MNELVKSVLPIGARLPPHNRAGIVVHARAFPGNVFAIRFHITLKEGRAVSFFLQNHTISTEVSINTSTTSAASVTLLYEFHKGQGYSCSIYRLQDNGGLRKKLPKLTEQIS